MTNDKTCVFSNFFASSGPIGTIVDVFHISKGSVFFHDIYSERERRRIDQENYLKSSKREATQTSNL